VSPQVALADTITIHDEVYVKGPKVLLGDVAKIEGEHQTLLEKIVLAPAALPGNTRYFDAALVQSRLRQAGIESDNIEVKGSRRSQATTLFLEITPGMIAEDLRNYVNTEMPWNPAVTTVDVTQPTQGYIVSDGDVRFRWKTNPQYDYLGQGTFHGEVLVDGKVERSFYTRAQIETYADVVIAKSDIGRGDLLGQHNLMLQKREISKLERGAKFRLEELEGQVAKIALLPGQVVTGRKVAPRRLIKRNQMVDVQTKIGSLTIYSKAQALNDGAAGDLVTCRSLHSKEEFMGILRKDRVVIID
jgi:flagella basal body P-ring formation protein FlgA